MKMGKNMFIAVTVFLVAVIVALSAMTLSQGPRSHLVELISHSGATAEVNDLYEGNTTIPFYDIPTNSYEPTDFVVENGVVEYTGGEAKVGINVNSKAGDIDWQQVKNNVDFAMIRVGHRENVKGRLIPDTQFEKNMQGASEAGLPVGVYFYSKAVSEAEAKEEANFVIEQIRPYSVTYPIAFYWEYDLKDDGTQDENSRTVRCNGDQVTGFIDTFCGLVKKATGATPCYYADKNMAYKRLDLSRLSDYNLWYAEFQNIPSFYYDFALWQYTKEGDVPGVSVKVPITLALKGYG
ncbi:MAG: Lyzozyme M1 (1,4-beta-N-acetylmuramidase) [Acutalibacter sp.]|nr:Lyzozyme M1 (1,4-beta-N-acetylmuramidase) [Acutalibacter sp.]